LSFLSGRGQQRKRFSSSPARREPERRGNSSEGSTTLGSGCMTAFLSELSNFLLVDVKADESVHQQRENGRMLIPSVIGVNIIFVRRAARALEWAKNYFDLSC
jgi:hypothetical protein